MSNFKVAGKFRILAYHSIDDVQNFESHIIYLKKNYNIIGLKELEFYQESSCIIPNESLLITFDDGDKSIFTKALPILKKHNVPAICFIITELIDTDKPFWWDEIEYYLGKEKGNEKVWEIKTWPNIERVNFLKELRGNSNYKRLSHIQLTTSQINVLECQGIAIANHSHTHPMFDRCSDEELEQEIIESKIILSSLKSHPNIFAYPNGNYSDNSEKILNKNRIKLAFLFDHKINKGIINPMRISRLRINDSTPMWKLKFILSGWHSKLLPVIKKIANYINR
jgi:poly-beta-1,6-N-acetyl-D-glucosamine N-deacetylase